MPVVREQVDILIDQIQHELNFPSYDEQITHTLIDQAKSLMINNSELRQQLGPLIGQLKSVPKPVENIDLNWFRILDGYIAIGHRPKLKAIRQMKLLGTTHIFTLLSENEGAKEVGRIVKKTGIKWLWLPLRSATPPEHDMFEEIENIYKQCVGALNNHGRIYIHCSAGIHRTGMIAYAFFRYIGYSTEESEKLLANLRGVTGKEVGNQRKFWGDVFSDSVKS